jgi:hypothetical protein
VSSIDERDRLAQLQRRALAIAIDRALLPCVEHVQPLLHLAGGARVLPMHVEAERAPVDLRSANIDQLAQLAIELDRVRQPEYRRVLPGRKL